MIKKLILAAALTSLCTSALSADDTYKRGRDKEFTAGCDNPTEREDGTPLALNEIANVTYYVTATDGDISNPLYTVIMTGGCTDVPVDLQQFPVKTDLYKLGTTLDTDGQLSVLSVSRSFRIEAANPKPPGQIR
jgi:hypothetical protein